MKRFILQTGNQEKGFWNKETQQFDFMYLFKAGSDGFALEEEEWEDELKKAKLFAERIGYSFDDVWVQEVGSQEYLKFYDKEDVDAVIKDSKAAHYFIYMETNKGKYFDCTGGFRERDFPQEDFSETGDYKVFSKETLKQGYMAAAHNFESSEKLTGTIKLHIFPFVLAEKE